MRAHVGVPLFVALVVSLSACGVEHGEEPQGEPLSRQSEALVTLACRPNTPQYISPAQYTACQGRGSGSPCSFSAPQGTLFGTCSFPPGATAMACIAAPPPAAVQACSGLAFGFGCRFFDGVWIDGTCQWLESSASTRLAETGQSACYGLTLPMTCPSTGTAFFGQDAQYQGPSPRFWVNGDGTVTDLVTGLTWTQALGGKVTWDNAMAGARNVTTGGYRDWRVPTIKELYSLIDFRGQFGISASDSRPFINTSAFEFRYSTTTGERFFDVQTWSSTKYVGRTMNGDISVFGVNFADGRIKSYPQYIPGTNNTQPAAMYVRFVRGTANYGRNSFVNNFNGTITDQSTGLVWQQRDDGVKRKWKDALAYCEALSLGGASDWRLPNAKELQSIVDYTRSPSVTGTAAIEPIFQVSSTESYYWTSTTVLEGPPDRIASRAVYIAFGRALGWMEMPPGSGSWRLLDTHGAGAQRSDLKDGDPATFPRGFGPQGDDVRIYNYVRCVRGKL